MPETRTQICMHFNTKEDKVLTRKYKAYVAKCTDSNIMSKSIWAKGILLG